MYFTVALAVLTYCTPHQGTRVRDPRISSLVHNSYNFPIQYIILIDENIIYTLACFFPSLCWDSGENLKLRRVSPVSSGLRRAGRLYPGSRIASSRTTTPGSVIIRRQDAKSVFLRTLTPGLARTLGQASFSLHNFVQIGPIPHLFCIWERGPPRIRLELAKKPWFRMIKYLNEAPRTLRQRPNLVHLSTQTYGATRNTVFPEIPIRLTTSKSACPTIMASLAPYYTGACSCTVRSSPPCSAPSETSTSRRVPRAPVPA